MLQLTLDTVPSAHDTEKRYYPHFDGKNWICDCKHYEIYKTDCRHILQKKLETERWQQREFNGPSYEPTLDEVRLQKQQARIFSLMCDGEWRTLQEIQEATGDPQASISAQLRHFRKKRFGSHIVDKRRAEDVDDVKGLWEYKLTVNEDCNVECDLE
jgi:hypothetical protein